MGQTQSASPAPPTTIVYIVPPKAAQDPIKQDKVNRPNDKYSNKEAHEIELKKILEVLKENNGNQKTKVAYSDAARDKAIQEAAAQALKVVNLSKFGADYDEESDVVMIRYVLILAAIVGIVLLVTRQQGRQQRFPVFRR